MLVLCIVLLCNLFCSRLQNGYQLLFPVLLFFVCWSRELVLQNWYALCMFSRFSWCSRSNIFWSFNLDFRIKFGRRPIFVWNMGLWSLSSPEVLCFRQSGCPSRCWHWRPRVYLRWNRDSLWIMALLDCVQCFYRILLSPFSENELLLQLFICVLQLLVYLFQLIVNWKQHVRSSLQHSLRCVALLVFWLWPAFSSSAYRLYPGLLSCIHCEECATCPYRSYFLAFLAFRQHLP